MRTIIFALRRFAPILALASLAFFGSGCSTFHRDYKAALAQPIPAEGIQGPWTGYWVSHRNQHTGRLRCIVTQTDPGKYEFRYHATFWKVFRAAYKVEMDVGREGGRFLLEGEEDLGFWSGGIYRYEGEATPANFTSTYKSKYDHGIFEMVRPHPSLEGFWETPVEGK